ncbi:porin [Cupriavidus basilensis]
MAAISRRTPGWSNAVGYYTPEINGLSGRFVCGLGEVAGTNSTATMPLPCCCTTRRPGARPSLIQRTRAGAGFPAKSWAQTALAAAVSYDFNFLKAFVQYDSTRNSGDSIKTDTVHVGMTVPYGNGKFMASAVQTVIKADGVATIRRSDLGFGYDYFLSKRSDLYANVLYDKLSRQGSGTAFGVGIRHKF